MRQGMLSQRKYKGTAKVLIGKRHKKIAPKDDFLLVIVDRCLFQLTPAEIRERSY